MSSCGNMPHRMPIHRCSSLCASRFSIKPVVQRRMGRLAAMHVSALIEFAPGLLKSLVDSRFNIERSYASLRKQALPHEEAFGLMLARLWVSPAFVSHGKPTSWCATRIPL